MKANLYRQKQERDSGIELLRIIAMFLIVMHHYVLHGGFGLGGRLDMNVAWIRLLSLGGKWGVDVFVLITGYFLVTSSADTRKILKLILQISFYSVGCFLIFGLAGGEASGIGLFRQAVEALLPIPYGLYWFATTYFILYLLVPFLNPFIRSLGRKRHLQLIVLLTVIWSLFPSFLLANFDMNNVGWFVYLYLTASFIRLYPPRIFNRPGMCARIGIGSYALILATVIGFDLLSLRFGAFANFATHFAGMNSILILVSALFTFAAFLSVHFHSRIVNIVASTTFGIYLLHDNVWMREFLWIHLFRNSSYLDTPYQIVHSLAVTTTVFAACSLIEYLRIRYLERPLFNRFAQGKGVLYRVWGNLCGALSRLYRKLASGTE